MSDTNAPEPTMEEILASIRRIISEDEAPPAAESSASAALHGEPAAGDDVLELTERVEPAAPPPEPAAAPRAEAPPPRPAPPPMPGLDALGDLDVSERPAPAPPRPASHPAPAVEAPLVSDRVADAAASHFGQLAQTLAMPAPGRTLEDLVRELLRPLLKEWLDQHLGAVVEQRVQAEVDRLSRGRGY